MFGRSLSPLTENTMTLRRCRSLGQSSAITGRTSPGCTVKNPSLSTVARDIAHIRTARVPIDGTWTFNDLCLPAGWVYLTEDVAFLQTACFIGDTCAHRRWSCHQPPMQAATYPSNTRFLARRSTPAVPVQHYASSHEVRKHTFHFRSLNFRHLITCNTFSSRGSLIPQRMASPTGNWVDYPS